MQKTELVKAVAASADLTQRDAQNAVNALTDQITESLCRGESVSLVGFGTFSLRERAARQGKNPRTGEPISIPAGKSVGFKAGKALKDACN